MVKSHRYCCINFEVSEAFVMAIVSTCVSSLAEKNFISYNCYKSCKGYWLYVIHTYYCSTVVRKMSPENRLKIWCIQFSERCFIFPSVSFFCMSNIKYTTKKHTVKKNPRRLLLPIRRWRDFSKQIAGLYIQC